MEAVNGAKLTFPLTSLCRSSQAVLTQVKPALQAITPASQLVPVQASSSADDNPRRVVKRELLANGRVRIHYLDGSMVERYKGGVTRIDPQGQHSQMLFSTAAPAAFPVNPPDLNEQLWLEAHRKNLLQIIESLIDNPELVQNYISAVDNSDNLFESIDTRSQTIQRLVAP